jgi:GT2 family glycosyltransferase
MPPAARVRAVVVNHNGGDLTIACIRSIAASDWPPDRLDIVVVDNASTDGSDEDLADAVPGTRVIRSSRNLGFGGACNVGMHDLGETEVIALVNNDATVEPDWLAPLVQELQTDDRIGAACPKILFAGEFREIAISSSTWRPGRLDRRDLGIWVSGVRVDGRDAWTRAQLVRGFWGVEPPPRGAHVGGQWTKGDAVLRVPAGNHIEIRLAARVPTDVRAGVLPGTELHVDATERWYTVTGDRVQRVINNVGSMLTDDHHGVDRGYLELDDERFNDREDVFAWCGAGVALRREYIEDVGFFDPTLFLYYEDLELSWRARRAGWRHRYVPESVLHHVHAATTIEGSSLKSRLEERNRLLVLTRHASCEVVFQSVWSHLKATASYARRDVISRLLHGQLPRIAVVLVRLRSFLGYLRRLPTALRHRRRDARRFGSPTPVSGGVDLCEHEKRSS